MSKGWEPKYVTLVSGESPCRGMDGLADGFMRWLGKERVRLHLVIGDSADIPEFEYFRPVYDWARTGTWEWTTEQTELLVVSTRSVPKIHDWVAAGKFLCPVASLDPRDKPCDEIEVLTGLSPVQVSFKLELPYTADPECVTFACPHGYVLEDTPPLMPYADRTIPVLFLGGETNLTRRALAEALQTLPNAKVLFNERIDRTQYRQMLANTKVGVACYGAGFASYRYWEVPAHGALLVAQPPPILIPHNFQRGTHALFYLTPQELLETVTWALDHPTEAEEIAKAGTAWLIQHHLTIHRAQYLAEIVGLKCQEVLVKRQLRFPW